MLKIKNKINLKKLKKFGFELNYKGNYEYNVEDNRSYIIIFTRSDKEEGIIQRQIALITGLYGDYPETYFDFQLDIIYDLIKADMVEKI